MRRGLQRGRTAVDSRTPRPRDRRGLSGRLAAACGGLALLLAAGGCGGGGSTSAGGRTPIAGGVVTYALPANTVPNYIFPFTSIAYFSVVNTDNLQYLLYRPLYWFGDGRSPFMNNALSLAYPPRYNGQVVTINLKHYRWSNGSPVTADDVLFWVRMMQAVGQADWGGWVPHEFPANISSVRAVSQTQVRMVIKGKYSHSWFTDNELSQITPMPQAWDYSSATTKSDCTHVISDCAAVYNYLNSKSLNPASWPASPIWSVVDGPWRLASYSSQGAFTFRLNPSYSGTLPKNHISVFTEVPFTSEEAEYNVLQAGGANQLDVGYLPTVDAPVPPPGAAVGQNPVSGTSFRRSTSGASVTSRTTSHPRTRKRPSFASCTSGRLSRIWSTRPRSSRARCTATARSRLARLATTRSRHSWPRRPGAGATRSPITRSRPGACSNCTAGRSTRPGFPRASGPAPALRSVARVSSRAHGWPSRCPTPRAPRGWRRRCCS